MWPTISINRGIDRRSFGGPGPARKMPEVWEFPGSLWTSLEMCFQDDGGDPDPWPEAGQVRRLGLAVLARALRDAAGRQCNPMEAAEARAWLQSGGAMFWIEAMGLRIHQSDFDNWLAAGSQIPKQKNLSIKTKGKML